MASDLNGIYIGIVVDNNDPNKLGRLKVKVPTVYGDIKTDDLPWCEPCFIYGYKDSGIFFVPDEGSLVVTMFINGSYYKPIWIGCIHREDINIIPQKANTNYPDRKIIKTDVGYLLYDDKDEYMELKHKNGSKISFSKDGDIIIHAAKDIHIMSDGKIYENSADRPSTKKLEDYSNTGDALNP